VVAKRYTKIFGYKHTPKKLRNIQYNHSHGYKKFLWNEFVNLSLVDEIYTSLDKTIKILNGILGNRK
jgi:hypothetical protein